MNRTIIAAALIAAWGTPTAMPLSAQDGTDRWSGELGLSVNSSGGNERLTVITTEIGLSHLETDVYELGLRGRVRYGRSEGTEVARNLRGSIDLDLWPGRGWSPFLASTAEQDPFRRLELRMNTGAGLKRTFWRDGWNEVSLSGAVLHSYENLEVPDTVGSGITRTARWSWRARGRRQIREGTRIQQVVFFQPAWNRFEDYQLESQTTARVAVSAALSVTTSLLYQRDNRPAPDVLPDDWSVSVGISLATAW